MGDTHVGLQARLMSQALRKLTSAISRSKCVMIFINQLREKVGVMFGSPETTSGGRALKFYASVRIDIRKLEQIKVGTDVVGTRTRAKVVKNKVAPPFRQAEFDITYGKGISKMGSILDVALERNIVGKSGSWYTYGESRIGQGRENAKSFLEEHSDMAEEIELKIREALKASVSPNGVAHPVGAVATNDDD
jgi:recombination protein RecA